MSALDLVTAVRLLGRSQNAGPGDLAAPDEATLTL